MEKYGFKSCKVQYEKCLLTLSGDFTCLYIDLVFSIIFFSIHTYWSFRFDVYFHWCLMRMNCNCYIYHLLKILVILCLLRKHQICLGRNQRHTWIFLIFSSLKVNNEGALFILYFPNYTDSIQALFFWIVAYFNFSVYND